MPWTPYFLRHLLEFDCPIIIGEGASESKQKNSDRSWDGSYELIKLFADRWKDRVTVYLHDYNLNTHGDDRITRLAPREAIKMKVWDEASDGEWIIGLSPDNIYTRSDIKKIKETCKHAGKDDYSLLTSQQVFAFNFKTIVKTPVKNICGVWNSLWPCIWRKNDKYVLILGDELLKKKGSDQYLTIPGLQFFEKDKKIRHIIFRHDIKQFHYKSVKRYSNRVQRLKSELAVTRFMEYPLESDNLKQYNL